MIVGAIASNLSFDGLRNTSCVQSHGCDLANPEQESWTGFNVMTLAVGVGSDPSVQIDLLMSAQGF